MKKMWLIAICDDSRRECFKVEELLENYCMEKRIAMEAEIFYDGSQLYEKMEEGRHYDLIFLDIRMYGMDGIEVARKIRRGLKNEEVQIVYMSCVTGHADLLLQNHPIGFVGKPVRREELYRAADDAWKLGRRFKKCFIYQKDRMTYQVSYEDILYFQSIGRKVEVHTVSGVGDFYGKLSDLVEKGLPEQFIQIHQSYIINRDFIVCFDRERVFLKGQKGYFSISQSYRQAASRGLQNIRLSDFVE